MPFALADDQPAQAGLCAGAREIEVGVNELRQIPRAVGEQQDEVVPKRIRDRLGGGVDGGCGDAVGIPAGCTPG